jgi:putative oxidoreductase
MRRTLAALLRSATRGGWVSCAIRWPSACVFVTFGAGKFLNHASETGSFHTYGLPWPGAFTIAIGVVELLGGVLLALGLATRPVALVFAGDMVGAIVLSGLLHGEMVSLTLAPALLVAMLVLASGALDSGSPGGESTVADEGSGTARAREDRSFAKSSAARSHAPTR